MSADRCSISISISVTTGEAKKILDYFKKNHINKSSLVRDYLLSVVDGALEPVVNTYQDDDII